MLDPTSRRLRLRRLFAVMLTTDLLAAALGLRLWQLSLVAGYRLQPIHASEQQLQDLAVALERHRAERGGYPTGWWPDVSHRLRSAGVISEETLRDAWGQPLVFEARGRVPSASVEPLARDYQLRSCGADRICSDGAPGEPEIARDLVIENGAWAARPRLSPDPWYSAWLLMALPAWSARKLAYVYARPWVLGLAWLLTLWQLRSGSGPRRLWRRVEPRQRRWLSLALLAVGLLFFGTPALLPSNAWWGVREQAMSVGFSALVAAGPLPLLALRSQRWRRELPGAWLLMHTLMAVVHALCPPLIGS